MKVIGEPCEGKLQARFDAGGGERKLSALLYWFVVNTGLIHRTTRLVTCHPGRATMGRCRGLEQWYRKWRGLLLQNHCPISPEELIND